jgi:hypothetical protein
MRVGQGLSGAPLQEEPNDGDGSTGPRRIQGRRRDGRADRRHQSLFVSHPEGGVREDRHVFDAGSERKGSSNVRASDRDPRRAAARLPASFHPSQGIHRRRIRRDGLSDARVDEVAGTDEDLGNAKEAARIKKLPTLMVWVRG